MGEAIVHLLLGSTILMVLLLALRGPLTRHAGPGLAYALWAVVALRLALPPIELPYGLFDVGASATQTVVVVRETAAPGLFETYGPALINIWLLGASALFALGLVSSLLFDRRLSRHAQPVGTVGSIPLFRSPAADSPVAVGLVRRRIYLPHDFASRWSEEEAAMILAHERVHHERGDLWANLLAFIILSLHWFNPVAWAAWKRFRVDQECACDARVLATRNAGERAVYGQALLKASGRETLPALTLALITPKTIVERIEMMRNMDSGRSRPMMIGLGALALLAVPATAATIADPEQKVVEQKRIVVFKSEDGETQTFTVEGDGAVEHDGTMIKIHRIEGEDLDGEHNVWVTNGDGKKFEVIIRKCEDGGECTVEVQGD